MKKYLLILLAAIVWLLGYLLTPAYQFLAHTGNAPMPWWGFVTIPDDIPQRQQVYNTHYQLAGEGSLALLSAHRQAINTPGISAAVAVDGEVVWSGSAGWADIKTRQPVTEHTQFRIGSTSKILTATLLARMVQENLVSVDNTLTELELPLGNSKDKALWSQITLRQLASHTSGMPHYKDNTERQGLYKSMALNSSYTDVMDAYALFDDSDLLFAPGTDFSYSSLGTVALSAALQQVGKQPFQTLMAQKVLQPLGLTHTSPSSVQAHYEQHSASLATFYWREDETRPVVRPWRTVDLSHRLAGGGFISTSEDLVRLGAGVLDEQFLSAAIRSEFWTPQRLNDGSVNEQNYALGWRVHNYDFGEDIGELKYAHHGGVSRGAQSWLMVIPGYNMAVAVNINAKTAAFWDFAEVAIPIASEFIRQRQMM
ncbi:serine hydrolase domain-containing protein [Alteromonas lipolytica]|uniref:Beta-lactamase-related domain-containing protein n=1 Tax=Alteromonas lipolytica TaxID=1856405 RepID=A0A1E8FCU7_9ALTE|nr:serine hydrolase domain-containing protein [Alteromonas lipolytica]OFI33757.1 hypothetical protein BFC17_19470 [Alteromonas lipolytica]GGF68672.1 serine hydrolase [Alteromonas lipolytica]